MKRIAFSSAEVRRRAFRRKYTPILSTIFVCMLTLFPVIVSSPVVPDFAFLVLIAWRLLRPEIWAPPIALGLGLFHDLITGHPIGQSMALWTILFIIFDIIDNHLLFRDYWMDWLFASIIIASYVLSDWYIGRLMGNTASFIVMLPQLGASVLIYPLVARIILLLDRWRLS